MKKNALLAYFLLATVTVSMAQVPLQENDIVVQDLVVDTQNTHIKKSLRSHKQEYRRNAHIPIIIITGLISVPVAIIAWKSHFWKKEDASTSSPQTVSEQPSQKGGGSFSGRSRHHQGAQQLAQVMSSSSHISQQKEETKSTSTIISTPANDIKPIQRPLSPHPVVSQLASITQELGQGRPQLKPVVDQKASLLSEVGLRGSVSNEEFQNLSQLVDGVKVTAIIHEGDETIAYAHKEEKPNG